MCDLENVKYRCVSDRSLERVRCPDHGIFHGRLHPTPTSCGADATNYKKPPLSPTNYKK
ncbi:hypothetical protein WN55_00731 [Dufourea novaeangliae]|uniref:Uncharacterized protein n=1 Tax=Dufourea novaeangliae TaxID=178035 RepID=A0A154NYA9_DUFNO|nr:hypothetical protein WN55_00731 [Dufourea novaeangliae]